MDEKKTMRVGSVEDVVTMIPFLLGFEPEESLVLMVVDEGRTQVTARMDLRTVTTYDTFSILSRLWMKFPTGRAFVLAISADRGLAEEKLAMVTSLLGERTLEAVLQIGREWESFRDPRHRGTVPSESPVAEEASRLGLVGRGSRADMAHLLDGPEVSVERLELLDYALAQFTSGEQAAACMTEFLEAGDYEVDVTAASLLAAVVHHDEAVQVFIDWVSLEDGPEQLKLWLAVNAHLPAPAQVWVLPLVALSAWLVGNGALMNICLERVQEAGSASRLAAALEKAVDDVVSPEFWPLVQRELAGL